jgi:hypothetical protein
MVRQPTTINARHRYHFQKGRTERRDRARKDEPGLVSGVAQRLEKMLRGVEDLSYSARNLAQMDPAGSFSQFLEVVSGPLTA